LNSAAPLAKTGQIPQRRDPHCYSVYGLQVRSTIPLTVPQVPGESACDIDVLAGDPAFFEESIRHLTLHSDWAQAYRLPGKWLYARLEGMFDFLVSPDGSRVYYRILSEFSPAPFETFLLGLLMKAVLIKRGIHSLHASSVVVDGRAVAFLGSNGFGKSSLAACFVNAGCPLLTDDVLRLDLDKDNGDVWAYPGPACLKLLPDARQWFDGAGAGVPMDHIADKWLFPVSADLQCTTRPLLAAIYCLIGPDRARESKQIAIEALKPREALAEILYGTYTDRVVEPDRVTNPLDAAKRIADAVPVRHLTHPWVFASLRDVRSAILADVRRF
jgi:hypothetical protein